MKEYVGECFKCQQAVYCHDGFLNGVVDDDHMLLCFSCSNENDRKG